MPTKYGVMSVKLEGDFNNEPRKGNSSTYGSASNVYTQLLEYIIPADLVFYVLMVGAFIWGAGLFWFVTQIGIEPQFVSEWLPGMALLGIGAGATFPNLSGAAVASAPGESFGTATGLNSVARQVGAALFHLGLEGGGVELRQHLGIGLGARHAPV